MKPGGSSRVTLGALLLVPLLLGAAPAIDESKLPPPATKRIDFAHDIQPIFANICLRCHGPERPKSRFRLTDRASALKGGNNGIDIIPGESAKSPLIHYTARLVPDMEMPPEGKGQPLSNNQVALLRAWIDQGAKWGPATVAAESAPSLTVASEVRWTGVHGDQGKFRELEWQPEGWNGGLEDFQLRELFPDGRAATVDGHVLRDDYKLTLDFRKPDLGFARGGFEQFRRYYDDAGGFYAPFSPALFHLGKDLHLDVGRVWTELGLTLPHWPRIVLGYEYQFKDGSKSMLTWGPVQAPTANFLDVRNIYPSSKDIGEHTHIIRFDLSYDLAGYELDNKLRIEFHESNTRRTDALNVPAGSTAPDLLTQVRQEHHYSQVADSVSLQKQFAEWWLAGIGYRYSWLDGDSSFRLTPQDGTGQPAAGGAWSADKILLNEVWQIANANSQFRPLPNTTATFGVQGEWKRQRTFGDANLDEVLDPTDPTSGIFRFPASELSTLDQATAEESFLVRYSGLPFTSIYGEARLRQEDYSRFAEQHGNPQPAPHDFDLESDANVRWQDYRVGLNTSPWRWMSLGGRYRHRDRQTDYAYPLALHDAAYPGFILRRAIVSDEIEVRVALQPVRWLKTTLTYQLPVSDYRTTTGATSSALWGADATSGGRILAGHYEANVFNASATVTPFRRLYLSAGVGYQNSRTTTADNGSPSVAPYTGDLWSAQANATYALNNRTDLIVNYLYSEARYGQHNAAGGLPLGIDFDRHGVQAGLVRRFSKFVTGRLQYGYFAYSEPSSGHLLDYNAHQVLAVLNVQWH